MQENRAFDHYYGKMKGVRGFNDRTVGFLSCIGKAAAETVRLMAGMDNTYCCCSVEGL